MKILGFKIKGRRITSEELLGNVQGVSEEEILVVEKVADDAVLL